MINDELLEEKLNNIYREIREGFKGVYTRQDIANGKLLKAELRIEELEKTDIRLKTKLDSLVKDEMAHIKKTNKWVDYFAQAIINAILILIVTLLIKTGILNL